MVCPCDQENAANPNAAQQPDCSGRLTTLSRRIRTVPRNASCRTRNVRSKRIRTGRSRGLKEGTAMNPNITRKTAEQIRELNRSRGCRCGTRRPNAFFG